jgi:UDP-2,3-diacylglucosamine pyrophosphatase LpxH
MLKFFFRDISRPLYGLEISQKLQASPGTTHRELNALLKQKILTKKKEGALVLYQLNTDHPHFLELQLTIKPPSKGDTIFFVSDIHLHDYYEEEKAVAFHKLLSAAEQGASELILGGDIFETMEGDIMQAYILYKPLIERLVHLSAQIKVVYVVGNHDLLFSCFLKGGAGVFFNSKIQLLEKYTNVKRGIYAEHGHRFDDLSTSKRDPKQHESIGKQLAEKLNFSWSEQDNRYYQQMKDVAVEMQLRRDHGYAMKGNKGYRKQLAKLQLQEAKKILKDKEISTVLMGHTHIAMDKKLSGGRYLNPGSWKHPEDPKNVVVIGKKGAKLKRVADL